MNEDLDEFIKRAEKIAKSLWEEYREKRRLKIEKWNNENREKLRKLQNEYSKSEKGKYAGSK